MALTETEVNMCDYDDFDDFDEDGFMDEDPFNDDDDGHDDHFADNPLEGEHGSDEFTATEAFFLGGAMGWAYEEGIDEGLRRARRRKRRRDADDDFI
jgi:hypothetical protein